ncbi:MAG: hypothetical protein AAGG75_05160 [Bacteroidota bacterium]
MNLLKIAVLTVLLFNGTADFVISNSNNVKTSPQLLSGGSIVMVDDIMMRTDTENPNEQIVSIVICSSTGVPVTQLGGCNESVCENDLSSLAKGNYDICVNVTPSRTFTGSITLD